MLVFKKIGYFLATIRGKGQLFIPPSGPNEQESVN